MLVKDIMIRDVVTVSSDTYVLDAERIMEFHKIGRLPVVDKGKLVGLITKDDILKASPSSTTPANQRQLFYLISKLTVRDIMKTNVVTVSPDTTIEKAAAIAQKNKIGCLPVVEGDRVLGIISQTDAFYKILYPLLGIGIAGTRIIVYGAGTREESYKITDIINKAGLRIKTFWIPPVKGRFDLVLHLDTDDAHSIIEELRRLGYSVDIRECKA